MKTINNLEELIGALSKQEKRYFKLYASRHTRRDGAGYTKLFDVLEKGGEGSGDDPATRLPFRNRKQFADACHYLYGLLLRSLDAFHAGNSADARLRRTLHTVKLLFEKALYGQCTELLDKAWDLAQESDNLVAQLEITLRISHLHRITSFENFREENIGDFFSREMDILKKTDNLLAYDRLAMKLLFLQRQRGIIRSSQERRKEYRPIVGHPLFKSEKRAITLQAKVYFHNVLGIYHFSSGEWQKGYDHLVRLRELMHGSRDAVSFHFGSYYSVLNKLIISCWQMGRLNEALRYIDELEDSAPRTPHLQGKIFRTVHINRMIIYALTADFEKSVNAARSLESRIKKLEKQLSIPELASVYYNLGCLYLIVAEHGKALIWINRILDEPYENVPLDIQSFTRILHLILQYEMGNHDVLPYSLRSAYRFLYKKKRMFRFEQIMLRYLSQFTTRTGKEALHTSFTGLSHALQDLEHDPYERQSLGFFDFISWLESKITSASFAEIVRRKALSNTEG